jgi:hypothetical protein
VDRHGYFGEGLGKAGREVAAMLARETAGLEKGGVRNVRSGTEAEIVSQIVDNGVVGH